VRMNIDQFFKVRQFILPLSNLSIIGLEARKPSYLRNYCCCETGHDQAAVRLTNQAAPSNLRFVGAPDRLMLANSNACRLGKMRAENQGLLGASPGQESPSSQVRQLRILAIVR